MAFSLKRRRQCYFLVLVGLVLTAILTNVSTTVSFPPPAIEDFPQQQLMQQPASDPTKTSLSAAATPAATTTTITTSSVEYPLAALNLSSAQESFQRGFWQRMEPVPLSRWEAVDNTTCLRGSSNSSGVLLKKKEWQYRVPYVILIGAQKGGSTALAHYLYHHPNIIKLPKKELHYFDEELDQRNVNRNTNDSCSDGIPSDAALRYYQEQVIGKLAPLEVFQVESSQRVLDATPNYLFASDRVPYRIFCITPWVKLLLLLRNPVDRAFSQYHMQFNRDLANPKSRRGGGISFEESIELDLRVLQETGVIFQQDTGVDNFDTFASFSGSAQELHAWKTYTKLGLNAPVGRGLYAIQLRHWLHAMEAFGKPRSELLVLQSEQLKADSNETYAKVLEFLKLRKHSMGKYGTIHSTNYRRGTAMKPETRAKLEAFYRPYNRQLEGLLGEDWQGVWE